MLEEREDLAGFGEGGRHGLHALARSAQSAQEFVEVADAAAPPDDPGAVSCGDVDGLPLGVDTAEEGGHRDVETGREPAVEQARQFRDVLAVNA